MFKVSMVLALLFGILAVQLTLFSMDGSGLSRVMEHFPFSSHRFYLLWIDELVLEEYTEWVRLLLWCRVFIVGVIMAALKAHSDSKVRIQLVLFQTFWIMIQHEAIVRYCDW